MVNHSSGGKSSPGSCRVHASVDGRRLKWRRGRHHPAPSPGSPGFIHPAADQFLGQLADPPFASHRLAAAMRRETSRRQSQIRLFHGKEIAFGRHAWSRLEIKFWSATEAHPLVPRS